MVQNLSEIHSQGLLALRDVKTYLVFTGHVQRAGYFIQNEDLWLPDQSSSDGDLLPLALR